MTSSWPRTGCGTRPYQAAITPVSLFQDGYAHRRERRDELAGRYGEAVVDRAMGVGS